MKNQNSEKKLCQRLTKIYKSKTVLDVLNNEDNIQIGKICPSDSDTDVKDLLYDFMTTHTYDNGLPLTGLNYPPDNPCEEHDFFDDHYDRSQIFWSIGTEEPIKEFFYDNGINVRLSVSLDSLKDDWEYSYDQSPYEDDFPEDNF